MEGTILQALIEKQGASPTHHAHRRSHDPPEVPSGISVPGKEGEGTILSLGVGDVCPNPRLPSPRVPSHHSPSQEEGNVDE